jgi:UDP-N-acetylmuramyl pentapeptide synthase
MEELGRESAELHRAVGASWPLQPGDRLVVLGDQAEAFAAGARSLAADAEIIVNPSRADAARLVREASGAVFLKGSRRYALENLVAEIPGPSNSSPHRAEVAA